MIITGQRISGQFHRRLTSSQFEDGTEALRRNLLGTNLGPHSPRQYHSRCHSSTFLLQYKRHGVGPPSKPAGSTRYLYNLTAAGDPFCGDNRNVVHYRGPAATILRNASMCAVGKSAMHCTDFDTNSQSPPTVYTCYGAVQFIVPSQFRSTWKR